MVSLQEVAKEADAMDDASLMQIPIDLFDHIDTQLAKDANVSMDPRSDMDYLNANNPEIFLMKTLKSCHAKSDETVRRMEMLEVVIAELF